MLTATMLSLTRSIVLRVPLVAFKSITPVTVQRSSLVSGLLPYHAFSTSPSFFAAASVKVKASSFKASGRSKTAPKTKVKPRPKAKANAKAKPKPKVKAKPKRKKAAPKAKVSTRVPLALRPPKRSLSPFILFYNRVFPSPSSRPGGILSATKEAGAAWRNLPEAEKKPYNDEAKVLLNKYLVLRDEWYKKPENAQVLRTLNKDRKKRGKNRIHAPATDAPKRPPSAYIRFSQELRATNKVSPEDVPEGNTSRLVWMARESGARWKALPAPEKEKYAKAYVADLAKWRAATAGSARV